MLDLLVRINVGVAGFTPLIAVGPAICREPTFAAFSALEKPTGSSVALVRGFISGFHFLQ